jgi:hypothetical protein
MRNKKQEFRRVFETLPALVIQDIQHDCAYHIPSEELEKYRATQETWNKVDYSTVTFIIPDQAILEETPPLFRSDVSKEPSVLIQYRRKREAYFLGFDELQKYKIPQPDEFIEGTLSFIIPIGMELLQEMEGGFPRPLQSVTGAQFTGD